MSESQAMQVFLRTPVTQEMIHHLVNVTLQVLPCESSKTYQQQVSSEPNSPVVTKTKPLPSLMTFITKLVRYTNVYTGTLMATIVYLNRLKSRLPKDSQGLPCTRHRIFLACVILSSKFHNDSSPKNKHWSKYTDGLFKREDVNLMERQLLMLLGWDLRISNNELHRVWKRFLDPIKLDIKKQNSMRNNLSKGMLAGSTQTVAPVNTAPLTVNNSKTVTASTNNNNNNRNYLPTPVSTPVQSQMPASKLSSMAESRTVAALIYNTPQSQSDYSASCSRSSSMASLDTVHSRGSSVSSVSSIGSTSSLDMNSNLLHSYRINDLNSIVNQKQQLPVFTPGANLSKYNINNIETSLNNYSINSIIDSVALNEERELNDLMRQYCCN